MDFRDSRGAIVNPTGKVEQHIGDTYNAYATYVQKTEKFPVPHQIKRPPESFTGHEELIKQILHGFDQGSNIIALRGIGGLGKTALAYLLAERMRDRYKDGQLMVDMRGTSPSPATPAQALSKLLRYYYPTVPLPESQEELQSIYLSTLEGKCVLILLDNALDGHQVLPLFPPDSCGLIITSRRKFPLDGMLPIDLDLLKPEEAVGLLLKTARPVSPRALPQEESIWKEIARICGCLPVALKAAGSYLACTPGSSPAKYVKELQDERKRLGIIGEEGVEEDLVTKLSLSYGRLAAETAKVFRLLSIFPADFFAQSEEAVCLDEGHRNLIDLQRWSLVEYVGSMEEGEGRYHLHDLVRLFAIGLVEKEEDEPARNDAKLRHCEHFRNVLSLATDLYEKGNVLGGLGIFDLERANIESAWEWAKENLAGSKKAASICSSFLNWPYLLWLRLHPQELISRLETALAAARKLNDRGMEGVHLGNLGNAYAELGNPCKAIEFYEQRLVITHEIGDRRDEGNALGNLGIAYADLGEPHKAIEFYEQALAIDREIGDRRGEGADLGNLGNAYADLGEPRKAIEYHKQALAIDREIGDRRGEGQDLGNLGVAHSDLGEPRKAIEFYKQALAIAREIGDRRNEGNWLGNLGSAYAALSEPRQAIEYYEQQLVITRKIGDRRGEAITFFNSSLALFELGKHSEAIEKAESSLQIFEQIESPYADRVKAAACRMEEIAFLRKTG